MPRKRVNPHTQAEVVEAALRVTDEVGLAAVTIRAVAAAAGAPPMSLYAYFGSKQELIQLMSAEVAARLSVVPTSATWQGAVEQICFHVRAVVLAHPEWLSLVAHRKVPTPLASQERLDALLLAAGLPPGAARGAAREATRLSLALTQLQLFFFREHASHLPREDRPPLDTDWDGSFAAAVGCWVAGLEALLRAHGSAATQRPSASTASPPSLASRSQINSERVATNAVIVPFGGESSLSWPPESGSSSTAPG